MSAQHQQQASWSNQYYTQVLQPTHPDVAPQAGPSSVAIASSSAIPPQVPTSIAKKCTKCAYTGVEESFPRKRANKGFHATCYDCTTRERTKKNARSDRVRLREEGYEATAVLSLQDFLNDIAKQRGSTFSLDTLVTLPPDLQPSATEQGKQPGTEDVFGLANAVRNLISPATEYRWSQKKRKELKVGTVITYYCSQLEGEQSKHSTRADKRPGWRYGIMQRFHCNGWLHITIMHADRKTVRIRLNHDQVHPPPESNPFVRDGRGRFVSSNLEVSRSSQPHDGNASGIETILDIPVNVQTLQVGAHVHSHPHSHPPPQMQEDPPEATISTPSDSGPMLDNDDGHATMVSSATTSVSAYQNQNQTHQSQAQNKRQLNGLVPTQSMNGTQQTLNTVSAMNGTASMNGISVSHSIPHQPQPQQTHPSPNIPHHHPSHNVQTQSHSIAPPPPPPHTQSQQPQQQQQQQQQAPPQVLSQVASQPQLNQRAIVPTVPTAAASLAGSIRMSHIQRMSFSREWLMTVNRNYELMVAAALNGVDHERAMMLESVFMQVNQIGEVVRASNEAETYANGGNGLETG